jgi:prepilin-type processing-associated H-X9-DG protein
LATGNSPTFAWPDTSQFTGVVFLRSSVSLINVINGNSNTFLVGEKYLDPNAYTTGSDSGDNECVYIGFDNDTSRTTDYPPQRDQPGYSSDLIFGSNHSSGLNMLRCDGSVSFITFDSDPNVFRLAGNRSI